MNETQLDMFLGDHEIDSVNDERAEKISASVREKIRVLKKQEAFARRRRLTVTAIAAAAVLVMSIAIFTIARVSEKSTNDHAPSSGEHGEHDYMYRYDTFENIGELQSWIKNDGKNKKCGIWMAENGIPVLTSLEKVENCRFAAYYNAIEVICDDSSIGNGYMIYLLDGAKGSIYDACFEAGIDIYAEYDENEYTFGQVYVNGKVCDGIKTLSPGHEGFYRYYIRSGKVLMIIDAGSDEKVEHLTLEYIK